MSVGRQPVLPQGLDAVGVNVGRRGIEVDDNMMTNVPGVYAIGDVNGRMMLAHAASAQGLRALHAIMGKADDIKLDIVPSAVFTVPELAMVGLTEEQCAEKGLDVTVKKSFFRSNGKAVAMNETDGLIKMIVDNATRQIVGCHICGAHAADLIQEVVTGLDKHQSSIVILLNLADAEIVYQQTLIIRFQAGTVFPVVRYGSGADLYSRRRVGKDNVVILT